MSSPELFISRATGEMGRSGVGVGVGGWVGVEGRERTATAILVETSRRLRRTRTTEGRDTKVPRRGMIRGGRGGGGETRRKRREGGGGERRKRETRSGARLREGCSVSRAVGGREGGRGGGGPRGERG